MQPIWYACAGHCLDHWLLVSSHPQWQRSLVTVILASCVMCEGCQQPTPTISKRNAIVALLTDLTLTMHSIAEWERPIDPAVFSEQLRERSKLLLTKQVFRCDDICELALEPKLEAWRSDAASRSPPLLLTRLTYGGSNGTICTVKYYANGRFVHACEKEMPHPPAGFVVVSKVSGIQ